jgi:cell pole-organizing protein PopZ
MSDPVTNVEIEDVLSSIRRLVSESGGAQAEVRKASKIFENKAPGPVSEAETPAEKPAVLDKLVLTPSLRVAEAPETVVESEDSSEPEAEAELEIEAADEAEDATEAVEHHAEVSEETQPEAVSEEGAERAAEVEQALEQSADEHSKAPEGESLKDRIEQLEAAVSSQDGEWEEENEESVETLQWEDHGNEDDTDENMSAPEAFAEQHHDFDAADEADEVTQAEDEYDFLAGDETLLDEDALREMVADIVRQELQGALGERITRNVRKLVRREIHRALMAQEFE